MAPPGNDDDVWFEDYDTDMSDGSQPSQPEGSPFASDSDDDEGGAGSGHSSSGEDDGFEERSVSEARSDVKRRLYTILDRQSLRRVQVLATAGLRRQCVACNALEGQLCACRCPEHKVAGTAQLRQGLHTSSCPT
jgi:hypothetical protein